MNWDRKIEQISRVLNDNQVTPRDITKQAMLTWMIHWATNAPDKDATPAVDMVMQVVGEVMDEVFGFKMLQQTIELPNSEDEIQH